MMTNLRIAVMRGGGGGEYAVSLASGQHMLARLKGAGYQAHDMLITRDGTWHMDGFPIAPQDLALRVDGVWSALHGGYGEDGKHQRVLERFSVPYTGPGAFPAAMATNKRAIKELFRARGWKTPSYIFIAPEDDLVIAAARAIRAVPLPHIVKPFGAGSSLGVSVAYDWNGLIRAIGEASVFSPAVLVEEYIAGRELSCAIIDGTEGAVYAGGAVEVVLPAGKTHTDHAAKYGAPSERVGYAGDVPAVIATELREAGKAIHALLGLRHYSKIDAVYSRRGLFLLEINGAPAITPGSAFDESLRAAGVPSEDMSEYIISLAFGRK